MFKKKAKAPVKPTYPLTKNYIPTPQEKEKSREPLTKQVRQRLKLKDNQEKK